MTLISLAEQPSLLSLFFLRPLGMMIIFPLLSSRSLGGSLVRNAIILAYLLPAIPILVEADSPFSAFHYELNIWLIVHEIFIGVLIGFVAAIPFWALDSAGYLIDTIRGSSLSSVINPTLGEAASIFGILFTQMYTALFFLNGGFNLLIGTLYDSWQLLPPGSEVTLDDAWLNLFLKQWDLLSRLAVNFALPSMVSMLLVDMALGLINRSAQQLNVFFLAMPLKSLMVIFILIVSIAGSIGMIIDEQGRMNQSLRQLLPEMSYE
jgi:type III secretion protein T